MDLLDDLLAGVRARGAVFCRSVVEPPWAVRFEAPAPLVLGTVLRGEAWLVPDGEDPVRVGAGDIVLSRGGHRFTAGDAPDTEPQIVVLAPDRCYAVADGPASAGHHFRLGPRTYGPIGGPDGLPGTAAGGAPADGDPSGGDPSGGDPAGDPAADGPVVFVTAEYALDGDVGERLVSALPPLAVVPRRPEHAPLLDLLVAEITREEPGQQVILDRLLDMLLVRALRAWFARPEAEPPAGYRALADPRVGRALRLLHERPDRPWTVAALAAETGLSRAVFARRFTALVGVPPLAYLTEWRMTLAADLLRERGASVASVARRVGYADGFSFSAAFKRVRGVTPSTVLRSRSHRAP